MPKLPESGSPSLTCPDRHSRCPMVADGEKCKYLQSAHDERLPVQNVCLDKKNFHRQLGYI